MPRALLRCLMLLPYLLTNAQAPLTLNHLTSTQALLLLLLLLLPLPLPLILLLLLLQLQQLRRVLLHALVSHNVSCNTHMRHDGSTWDRLELLLQLRLLVLVLVLPLLLPLLLLLILLLIPQ